MAEFLSKILALLPKAITDHFQADKIMHFIVGAAIGVVALFMYGPLASFVWALIAGILKEVWDYVANERALKKGLAPPHGVELKDMLATTAGGAAVGIIAFVLTLIL